MMKDTALNMIEELFIEKLHASPVYYVVEGAEELARDSLEKARTPEEKIAALSEIMPIYLAQRNYLEAYFLIKSLLNDPFMLDHKSYVLFQKGRICEFLYEFNDALICYCRALTCPMIPDEIVYDLWNNTGFCWLYKRNLKSAEICCRRAIELDMNRWGGWKNLAVSLEHQQCFKESLSAYIKAVGLSKGNEVAVLHLWRFDKRHPDILPNGSEIRQEIYKEYQIII